MQSKKYSEASGEVPFDWYSFLERAYITEPEWENAEELSKSWVTCACGNLCQEIPRYEHSSQKGMPIDDELRYLGNKFHRCILHRYIDDAKSMLQRIEVRSSEILKELNPKK